MMGWVYRKLWWLGLTGARDFGSHLSVPAEADLVPRSMGTTQWTDSVTQASLRAFVRSLTRRKRIRLMSVLIWLRLKTA